MGDIHEHRVKLMEESAQRLGVKIVKAKCMDATRIRWSERRFKESCFM